MEQSVLLSRFLKRAAELGGGEHAGYALAALAEAMCGAAKPFSEGLEYNQTVALFGRYPAITRDRYATLLSLLKEKPTAFTGGLAFRSAMRRANEKAEGAKSFRLYADVFYESLLEELPSLLRLFLEGKTAPSSAPAPRPVTTAAPSSAPAPRPTTTTASRTAASRRTVTLDSEMKEKIRSYQKAARSTPCVRELADHFSLPDEILRTKITDREALRRLRRGRFGFATVRYPNGTTCEHRIYNGDGLVILDEREHDPIVFDSFVDDSYFAECLGFQSVDLRRREGRDIFSEVFVSFKLNVYFESALKWGEVLAVAGYPVSLYYDEHDRFWYVE